MQLKRRSYTASFKTKVVAYSEEVNTHTGRKNGNRNAAKLYGVNESQVRKWKANIDALRATDGCKGALRSAQPKWPDLEESLRKWVIEQRKKKRKVSTIQIRLEAKRMAAAMDIMNFKAGSGWCNRFMQRAGLSVGATTSIGQHPPENAIDLMDSGQKRSTRHHYNDKIKTGGEKTDFTVVLGVTADGRFCPPKVIFKRKTISKDTPPEVVVKANCWGWMNEVLMTDWIETCWMARKDPATSPEQAVPVLDSARCHLTLKAKEALRRRTKIVVIPGGLTKNL
ncbi:unnamed protein product [Cylicocyclus nassatus]|uniref:HTH CENPB-type domain-containing protein n=1 Tax=Cylicocyclus nassatus TaxID=53992 RepID=A0AA36H4K7_CYLNA|nr:unnamed protein product [Cylicocyclus nassatus]